MVDNRVLRSISDIDHKLEIIQLYLDHCIALLDDFWSEDHYRKANTLEYIRWVLKLIVDDLCTLLYRPF